MHLHLGIQVGPMGMLMIGLLITILGASFTAPDERGDQMFLAMARGHLQQCVDLGSGEFID